MNDWPLGICDFYVWTRKSVKAIIHMGEGRHFEMFKYNSAEVFSIPVPGDALPPKLISILIAQY